MSFRPATGRPIKYKARPVTLRDLMRRHMKEEKKTIKHDLSKWWNMHPNSAYRRMYDYRRPMSPAYVVAFVEGIGLDEFDASELHLHAAIEAGYDIRLNRLMR